MTQQDNSQDLTHADAEEMSSALALAELATVIQNLNKEMKSDIARLNGKGQHTQAGPNLINNSRNFRQWSEFLEQSLTKHAHTITQGQKLKRLVDAALYLRTGQDDGSSYLDRSSKLMAIVDEFLKDEAAAELKGE